MNSGALDPNNTQALLQYAAQQQPGQVQSAIPSVVPQPHDNSSWWQKLLPTAGTMLGGVLAPETGGLSLLLAGLGGAAGKAAENLTEGQDPVQGNVLKEGLMGAAGEGVGQLAGKAIGGIGGVLGARGTKLGEEAAMAKKAAQGVEEAKATQNSFGGVKDFVQSQNELGENQGLLKQIDVHHTSPQAMNDASKAGLFIDDIDRAALATGKPIKTTDLISSRDITSASPEEQASLMSPKVGIITPDGTIPQQVTPLQAHEFAKDLNTQLRDLEGVAHNAKENGRYSEYNVAKQHLADLQSRYKSVQNLASSPEVNASIAARTVSPAEKAQLVEKFGQKQADYVENAINTAQTHQDLVAAKRPFAQMNTVSDLALDDLKATGTARAVSRAKAELPQTGAPTPTKDALKVTGAALLGTGHPIAALTTGAAHLANNPKFLNILDRIANSGIVQKGLPAAGGLIATSPNMISPPTNQAMQGAPAMNPQPFTNPYTQSVQTYDNALQFAPWLAPSIAPNGPQSIIQPYQQVGAAGAALNGAQNQFQAAGGAQGPVQGILGKLGALLTGGPAASLDQTQAGAAQAIAKALGVDPSVIQQLLPSITQNQLGAGSQTQALSGILSSLGAPQ